MSDKLTLREEASLVLGYRLPDDPLHWEPFLKSLVSGQVDMNKKWNMTIMLMMRLDALEKQVEELMKK